MSFQPSIPLLHKGVFGQDGKHRARKTIPWQQQRYRPMTNHLVIPSVDHLFCQCAGPLSLWYRIMKWWGFCWCPSADINDMFEQWESMVSQGTTQRKIWCLLFYVVVWSIWKARNELIFEGKNVNWLDIYHLIFVRLKYWATYIVPHFPYQSFQLAQSSECIKFWTNIRSKRSSTTLTWNPPSHGWLKWNVDGSSLG
ncbi:uncharacterized protein LOC119994956 [Tripterygium wilfordii]|uniref:uncharacterized protein LOC119994956 n=1 Tax=Tripterygium wilfordii TaxID=458696 RepID=UPI0018F8086A|nr:uncharacterized protein LOC119994956 [Tripterygium wilfordii]